MGARSPYDLFLLPPERVYRAEDCAVPDKCHVETLSRYSFAIMLANMATEGQLTAALARTPEPGPLRTCLLRALLAVDDAIAINEREDNHA